MNNFNIKIGIKGEKEELVTTKNTAIAFGSGSINVYATPAMIGLIEGACLSSIDDILPSGFSSVGTKLDVEHISATPLNMKVKASSELIKIEGKKLTFKVEAVDEKEIIGTGFHERYIVEVEKFLNRTQNK